MGATPACPPARARLCRDATDRVVRGPEVRAIVTDAWGNEVAAPEVVIDPGAADRWLALPVALPAELAPGQYGVFVFADDRPLGSLAFGVTGVGTSAQLLPEMPANPQVRSTVPPPGAGRPRGNRPPRAGKRLRRWRLPADVVPINAHSVPLPQSERRPYNPAREDFCVTWRLRTTPDGKPEQGRDCGRP